MNQDIQRVIAFLVVILLFPALPFLFILVKLDSPGPFFFKQMRAGKDKKPFRIYKIRTMVYNAEELKSKYYKLNEADGPVFKIRNDPRYTKIGKLLSRIALDEAPQFINVLRGEMAIVGPRPLPVNEALKVPHKYGRRFSVLPGMTSPWVIKGLHALTFEDWMKLDLQYVEERSFLNDIRILAKTFILVGSNIINSTRVI